MNKSIRCVFFDRDGIVNKSPGAGYVLRPAEFKLTPEFPECVQIAAVRGYCSAIVTNQSAIAKGILSVDTLEGMHSFLSEELRRREVPPLLDIIYCPHNPGECDCRKPQPGMLLALAERHNIDLHESWMVGDMETDVEAGRRSGCKTIRVHPTLADIGSTRSSSITSADFRISSMRELPSLLKRVLDKNMSLPQN